MLVNVTSLLTFSAQMVNVLLVRAEWSSEWSQMGNPGWIDLGIMDAFTQKGMVTTERVNSKLHSIGRVGSTQ